MKYIASMDQDHRIWVWLHHTLHVVYRAREKELDQFGISLMQAGVLFAVQKAPKPVTCAKIARWLLREPNSMHTLLNRMVQQGLLYKTNDTHDKRLVRIILTERGRQLYKIIYARPLKDDVLNRVFSTLSSPEKQQLEDLLRRVLHATIDELQMHRALRYF